MHALPPIFLFCSQVRPGKWDERITTNAAVTVRPDGSLLMVYKGSCCDDKQATVASAALCRDITLCAQS